MILIGRVAGLVQELRGDRASFHPSSQQETRGGIVLRFLGRPCEFATPDCGCAYPGLGWRCGHRCRPRRRLRLCLPWRWEERRP